MSDEKTDSATSEPPEEQSSEKSISKLRLKRRRRIWTLIILLVICFLVNGPFARWLALYGLNKGLEAQGMTGSAGISGTLSQGFTIHDLSYSGSQGIQSLTIDELAAHYNFTELFKGRMRSLSISEAKVIIDLDAFPSKEEEDESEKKQIRETLATLHGWISQPKISISDLDVSFLKSGEKQAQLVLSELNHEAGTEDYIISGFTVTDREERTTPSQTIHIVWKSEAAAIDRFEFLPDIAVENVAIDWRKDFQGKGLLKIQNSKLQVTADESSITAALSNGSIDSKELNKRFDLGLPAEFTLAGLDINISKWQQPIPQWDIKGALKISSAEYDDYQLTDTTIKLTQKELGYQLGVVGKINTNPLTIRADGKWLAPESEQWWSHTSASYKVDVPKLGTLTELIEGLPEKLHLTATAIRAEGEIAIKDNQLTKATMQGQVSGVLADQTTVPPLDLRANYEKDGQTHAKLTAQRNGALVLQLDADYHLENQDYQGDLTLNEASPDWINALAGLFNADAQLSGPVALSWSGQGNAKDFTDPKVQQKGKLKVEKLLLTLPNKSALDIATEINYQWPESVSLPFLTIREGDWLGSAKLAWDGKNIAITNIDLKEGDQQLATINGKLPFQKEIDSSRKFLAQKEPWNISVKTQPIALNKLQEWFKIDALNQLTGTTDLNVELSGSPSQPEVKGSARASDVKGFGDSKLLPLNAVFQFYSENKKLIINGNLLEGESERFTLKGSLPFTPSAWVKDPDFADTFVTTAPLSAEIKINTLPLGRLKKFVPQLKAIQGTIDGKATLSGTIEQPNYLVTLDADIPLLRLEESDIGDIRNIKLSTRFTESQKANTKLTAQINGGKFEAGGTVDLKDRENPVFDLYLRTQYALVHRDDLVSIRANSNLQLKGKMEDATLSGSIGIAESLFYKDIELIPIGVPSSEVAKVNMPALSKKKADERLPIPEPFADWKLDVTLRTDDPVLIRGNVASGNLTGSVKVGGTLAKPAPQGTILVNKVKAKLPFSILEIAKGEIKFTPENGLDPTLNIRGKSTVGAHDVSVFVYGSASSPKTTFTSYPPLPETEVMTLIATGTTTAGLENRSVATFKAFQVFLMKLQQRNDKPGGNKLFKTLLSGIDDLNLNVGETDPFTGRKFTSATVDIHPHWNFTTQVDDTQQTRGLIVYVIRFR